MVFFTGDFRLRRVCLFIDNLQSSGRIRLLSSLRCCCNKLASDALENSALFCFVCPAACHPVPHRLRLAARQLEEQRKQHEAQEKKHKAEAEAAARKVLEEDRARARAEQEVQRRAAQEGKARDRALAEAQRRQAAAAARVRAQGADGIWTA